MPNWVVTVWEGTKQVDQWPIENKEHAEAVRQAQSDVVAVYGEDHYWMVAEDFSADAGALAKCAEPTRRPGSRPGRQYQRA